MRILLDTSLLVAAMVEAHPVHSSALPELRLISALAFWQYFRSAVFSDPLGLSLLNDMTALCSGYPNTLLVAAKPSNKAMHLTRHYLL